MRKQDHSYYLKPYFNFFLANCHLQSVFQNHKMKMFETKVPLKIWLLVFCFVFSWDAVDYKAVDMAAALTKIYENVFLGRV